MLEILIATNNAGKVAELKRLLAGLPIRLRGLDEFPNIAEAEETGATFAENAALKARFYALAANSWSLADDSGLEVSALGGAPGIFSARYGGAGASDAEKIAKLLDELNEKAAGDRAARFVCAMAICSPGGEIKFAAAGECRGTIAARAAGANGFGYDPIFIPDGFAQTFAELPGETKEKISHRARAFEKIIGYLRRPNENRLDQ